MNNRKTSACIDAAREYQLHSHCSYCGTLFPGHAPWPRNCESCGNRSYLNPLPVIVVLVPVHRGLIVIRRNIEPGKGELALPGGYLDLGESWQEGARRELCEETGIEIDPARLKLYEVMNGLDGTLIIFGLSMRQRLHCLRPFSSSETQEVLVIDRPMELAFSMHTEMVARYFARRKRN